MAKKKMIIKVCGLRDPGNIASVEALDIDWMGFVFYPRSPRCVPEDSSGAEAIRRCRRRKAGVFVNDTVENMAAVADDLHLHFLQLHGDETPETCTALQRRGYEVIKAFPVATADDLKRTEGYAGCADYFLFDTRCEGHGGSGRRFDWSLLENYKGDAPFLLSGGLAPDCAEALRAFRHPQFAGIDLNSGFETSPGIKDAEKIKAFIRRLNAVQTGF